MSKKKINKLQNDYEKACINYVNEFLKKQDFYDEEIKEVFDYEWLGDRVGQLLCVSDYYIDFNDIKLDIDKQAPKGAYLKYYDYYIDSISKNQTYINYDTYLKSVK